jgi:hypothetical protein
MNIEEKPENPLEQHNLTNQSGTSPGDKPRNASKLDSCRRTKQQDSVQPGQPQIGRPPRDEPFTRVDEGIALQCIIYRNRDQWGNYTGEEYYPVTADLHSTIPVPMRTVAFHPCISKPGQCYICPQKVDPPGSRSNPWNASLAEALSVPSGQWLKIWSDRDAERYQHELLPPQMEGTLEYPDFAKDLEKALVPNIIDTLNHPVLQRLLDDRAGRNNSDEVY